MLETSDCRRRLTHSLRLILVRAAGLVGVAAPSHQRMKVSRFVVPSSLTVVKPASSATLMHRTTPVSVAIGARLLSSCGRALSELLDQAPRVVDVATHAHAPAREGLDERQLAGRDRPPR